MSYAGARTGLRSRGVLSMTGLGLQVGAVLWVVHASFMFLVAASLLLLFTAPQEAMAAGISTAGFAVGVLASVGTAMLGALTLGVTALYVYGRTAHADPGRSADSGYAQIRQARRSAGRCGALGLAYTGLGGVALGLLLLTPLNISVFDALYVVFSVWLLASLALAALFLFLDSFLAGLFSAAGAPTEPQNTLPLVYAGLSGVSALAFLAGIPFGAAPFAVELAIVFAFLVVPAVGLVGFLRMWTLGQDIVRTSPRRRPPVPLPPESQAVAAARSQVRVMGSNLGSASTIAVPSLVTAPPPTPDARTAGTVAWSASTVQARVEELRAALAREREALASLDAQLAKGLIPPSEYNSLTRSRMWQIQAIERDLSALNSEE